MIGIGAAAVDGSGFEDAFFEVFVVVQGFIARAVVGTVVCVVDCFMVGLLVVWGCKTSPSYH